MVIKSFGEVILQQESENGAMEANDASLEGSRHSSGEPILSECSSYWIARNPFCGRFWGWGRTPEKAIEDLRTRSSCFTSPTTRRLRSRV